MTSTNAVDLNKVPFAQKWETNVCDGTILLTHPSNLGSMVYVPDQGIVMVMSKQNPTQVEITNGISFHLRYADFSIPLVERLLEAENNALSNNRKPATQLNSPFAVFEYLKAHGNKMVAVIQCTHHPKWVIIEDQADLAKLEAAISTWNKPGVPPVEQLAAKNVIKLFTNNWTGNFYVIKRKGDRRWRSIVVKSSRSDSDAIDDIFFQTPLDDEVEYGAVTCHTCGFQTGIMHWRYDLGDKMKELEIAWNNHHDTGCSTPRLSYV